MRILILCTGNSCRSQMAQGYLQSFDSRLEVYSAGTLPEDQINPLAIKVMALDKIDISDHMPTNVSAYLNNEWDYVITVCDHAKETCPAFVGKVKKHLHIGFKDPSKITGSDEQVITEFIKVRDEIKCKFYKFYQTIKFD